MNSEATATGAPGTGEADGNPIRGIVFGFVVVAPFWAAVAAVGSLVVVLPLTGPAWPEPGWYRSPPCNASHGGETGTVLRWWDPGPRMDTPRRWAHQPGTGPSHP